MTVTVTNFGGTVWTIECHNGHSSDIDPSAATFIPTIGGEIHDLINIECPVCGTGTTHPAGGGIAPESVQQMFVLKAQLVDCPCGNVTVDDTESLIESHVRLNCNRMDGPGRWRLDQSATRVDDMRMNGLGTRENPNIMFQTVSRKSDGLILGMNAKGGVGPDNSMNTWHSEQDYIDLMSHNPAYVNAAGDKIVGEPGL